jgi:hypothetical protein
MSITTVVASGCDLVASLRTEKRLGSLSCEQQPRTSDHRDDADPYIVKSDSILVSFLPCFKFEHFIIYVFIL